MSKRKKSKIRKDITWYNSRKRSLNKSGKSAIEKFIDYNYKKLGLRKPDANMKQKKLALNVVLSNVYDEYYTGRYIAIPFNRGYYTNATKNGQNYNTYEYIVGGTSALISYDYLEIIKGHYNKERPENNLVTRIKAKKKLIDEINSYIITEEQVQNYYETDQNVTYILSNDEFAPINFEAVVELKDKDKKIIDYRPHKISERSKKFLRAYNSFSAAVEVVVPLDKIKEIKYKLLNIQSETITISNTEAGEYTSCNYIPLIGCCVINYVIYKKLCCQLKRTFNDGSFECGGRFYEGDYQFLSKKERSWIKINGEAVVEIDYKSFHPRILYHKKGIDMKGDLYTMVHPDKELREPIKKMLNIMINSHSDYNAKCAFEDDLEKEENGNELRNIMLRHKVDEWDLIRMIRSTHKRIETDFSSNKGIEMQYEDSVIAMKIMEHFMTKGVLCLCVHDSLLVAEKYKDELYDLMKTEYKKMYGFEPELEIIEKEQSV